MQNWNRRDVMRVLGFSSLGLGLSSCTSTQRTAAKEEENNDNIMRLVYNENPYGPSQRTKRFITENIHRSNRYSTFDQYDHLALKRLIANQEGLQVENILLGHGSFEPLIWLATHFGIDQGEIIVPSPTFDVVGLFARKIDAHVVPVEVTNDFKMNLPEMANQMSSKTKLLTLCNPNNPTGTMLDANVLRDFCRSTTKKCPVLIDEAYIQYTEDWRKNTMAPLISEGHNLLVTRTFSKIYGMAGLRIGFLMGPAAIIAELENKFTLGFPGNMPNTLSVAAAIGALKDSEFIDISRRQNHQARKNLYDALEDQDIPFVKSQTNFVYFYVDNFSSFKSYMRKNNILIAGGWPSKPDWARVTIGEDEEMAYFKSKLKNKPWL